MIATTFLIGIITNVSVSCENMMKVHASTTHVNNVIPIEAIAVY